MKRSFALLLALLMSLCLLAGCGGGYESGGYVGGSDAAGDAAGGDAGAAAPEYFDDAAADVIEQESSSSVNTGGNITAGMVADVVDPESSKLIYRAELEMETTEFDTVNEELAALVKVAGGYFESKSVSDNNYRHASYIIRVPAANFESFLNQAGALCLVTSNHSTAENVSEVYYDIEARLATQRTKLERLQNLLAQAETMEDIITIESAISDTELAIEQLTGSLRSYDALIDYATVTIWLSEVYKLRNMEGEAPITFGERVGVAFRSSITAAGDFMENLVIGFASSWIAFLILAALCVVAIIVVRRERRKKKAARQIGSTPPAEEKKE